ncbi:MAG: V-type ATPase subunit [Clostridia bacterium]|nr:V-type ATPase subunit [Clostridia bacterium]
MKDNLYSNGVAAACSVHLLTNDIYNRLIEAKNLEEALSILSETSFVSSNNTQTDQLNKDEIVFQEFLKLIQFIKTESPNKNFLKFLLLPYDYNNIATFIKCGGEQVFDDLVEVEGEYSKNLIKEFVQSKTYSNFNNKHIAAALEQVDAISNKSGWETDFIFKNHLYKNLLELHGSDKVLKSLIANKVDCENLSVCLRAKTQYELESQLLTGGNLKKQTIVMLFEKKSSALNTIQNNHIKELAKVVLEGSNYSKFEVMRNNLELNILRDHKYDIETLAPFAFYVYQKFADVKNVRLILSYQQNNLKDKIKNKLLGVI